MVRRNIINQITRESEIVIPPFLTMFMKSRGRGRLIKCNRIQAWNIYLFKTNTQAKDVNNEGMLKPSTTRAEPWGSVCVAPHYGQRRLVFWCFFPLLHAAGACLWSWESIIYLGKWWWNLQTMDTTKHTHRPEPFHCAGVPNTAESV